MRRDKRDRLLADGVPPYAAGFARTTTLAALKAEHEGLAADVSTGQCAAVAGRVIFLRNTGRLCFATLRDGDGTELQAMLSVREVGEGRLAAWKSMVDIGDYIGVEGQVITSRRGELSVLASSWTMLAKALRPLPVAHKAMSEETRVRQRYVDLIVRPDARRIADVRIQTVQALRASLAARGFAEVETPMLHAVQGGATAKPFRTHYNAYDIDAYLRIAPELFLKRCVIGGLEKVFEINRNFRNEGADSTHAPEFTMLEAYQAFGDYNSIATLTRELYQEAATAVFGSDRFTALDGQQVDLSGDWQQRSLYDMVSAAVGAPVTPQTPGAELLALAGRHGVGVDPSWLPGKLVEEMFEALCGAQLSGPIFVRDFPLDTSPLVREHRSQPGVVEKWDLYIDGVEGGTGYTELTDPVVQRERLVAQARQAAAGDDEAMRLDEDFLRALEYGMPPLGGVGFGIDRLLMTFVGRRSIRETILFPFVRPE